MDEKFLRILPGEFRATVAEIEDAVRAPIRVVARTAEHDYFDPSRRLLLLDFATENGGGDIYIRVPAHEDPDGAILTHEIIHARRNFLENIPRLTALPGGSAKIPELIENDVEHLSIIPEELKYFPQAIDRWYAHYDEAVNQLSLQAQGVGQDLNERAEFRDNALRHFLLASTVLPEWPGRARLRALLQNFKLAAAGRKMLTEYPRTKGEKTKQLMFVLRQLQLSPDQFRVRRMFPLKQITEESRLIS